MSISNTTPPKITIPIDKLPELADNYVLIRISYGEWYVFPFETGMDFLNCFKKAERYIKGDYDNEGEHITDELSIELDIQFLSEQQYKELKMARLLK